MGKQEYVFLGVMTVVLVAMLLWVDVSAWPKDWVRWRAERGDCAAMEVLYKQAAYAGDVEGMAKWSVCLHKLTQQDVLFMVPESRKIMRKLFEAQGKDTSLLDVVEEK